MPGELFSRHLGTGAPCRLSSPLSLWQGENDFDCLYLMCFRSAGCERGSGPAAWRTPLHPGSAIYIALMYSCQRLLKHRLLCARFSSLGNPFKYLLALLTCLLSIGRAPFPSLCLWLIPDSCPVDWSFPRGENTLDQRLQAVENQRQCGALRNDFAMASCRVGTVGFTTDESAHPQPLGVWMLVRVQHPTLQP